MDGGERKLKGEAADQFKSGIDLCLSRWYTLQMAVGGDRRIYEEFIGNIYSLFTSKSKDILDEDRVEETLEDAMDDLRFTLQDGSQTEIASKLMTMYEECLEGNFSSIALLEKTRYQRSAVPNVSKIVDSSDDDCDESDMVVDVTSDDSSDMALDVTPCQSTTRHRKETTGSNSSIVKPPHVEVEDGWTVVDNKRNRGRNKERVMLR